MTDIQNTGSNDSADLIGILAGLVILFFLFRSVLAAFLPIGVAIFGVVIAGSVLLLLATQVTIGTVAPILGSMIGLGVGIDYSLLVLSRYLQNRDEGMDARGRGRARDRHGRCGVAVRRVLRGDRAVRTGPRRHPVRGDARLLGRAVRGRHGARGAHAPPGGARLRRAADHAPAQERRGRRGSRRHVVPLRPRGLAPRGPLRGGLADRARRPRRPDPRPAARLHRRRQRPDVTDPAQGLRPHQRGLR